MIGHIFRTARYAAWGLVQPPVGPFDPLVTKLFVGPRMLDAFGHVNNAKYLEIYEFARWNQGTRGGSTKRFYSAGLMPVVGAAHVSYLAQMKAFQFVHIETAIVGGNDRTMLVMQHIYSPPKGGRPKKVYSTALFRCAILDARAAKPVSLSISEACHRMGLSASPDVLPEALVLANAKLPEYLSALHAAEDAWRTELRPARERGKKDNAQSEGETAQPAAKPEAASTGEKQHRQQHSKSTSAKTTAAAPSGAGHDTAPRG